MQFLIPAILLFTCIKMFELASLKNNKIHLICYFQAKYGLKIGSFQTSNFKNRKLLFSQKNSETHCPPGPGRSLFTGHFLKVNFEPLEVVWWKYLKRRLPQICQSAEVFFLSLEFSALRRNLVLILFWKCRKYGSSHFCERFIFCSTFLVSKRFGFKFGGISKERLYWSLGAGRSK